jgi:hypothetical protein
MREIAVLRKDIEVDRFIDHLLRTGPQAVATKIPGFDSLMLEQVRNSVVILGDNVSDYYYEGNEQEDWMLEKDFPNVAPPFDLFFLDFKAPSFVNSSVTGRHPWPKGMPISWGLLCQGKEQGSPPIDFSQESHRRGVQAEYQKGLVETRQECSMFGYDEQVPDHEIPQRFTAEQQSSIDLLKRVRLGCELIQKGDWEAVERLTYRNMGYHPGAKWILSVSLFAEYDFSHQKKGRVAIIPAWQWDIPVNAQGAIIGADDLLSGPLAKESLLQTAEPGEDLEEIIDRYAGGYYPLLCTGLLTLSFLHCKNVTVKTVEEPGSSEQSTSSRPKKQKKKRQKQTAISAQRPMQPPRPSVTYHILDVEPMKKVLRTEGQVEEQGLKRAMHICRGHFAHYEEGKGLFGKYHGTYWRAQHMRGSADQGTRIKDYRIKDILPSER